MSLREIEEAITRLAPKDLAESAAWFEEYREQASDGQIARDARAGRFDEPVGRAQTQFEAGQCRPDRFFSRDQIERLAVLMDRWRQARDRGDVLPDQEQSELEILAEAELNAALRRAKAWADASGSGSA